MNKVITISGTTLAILSVFFITLSSINLNTGSVHAAETSTDTEVALNVDSVINISAPTTATLNCTPGATAAAAQLCTTTATVGVGTNNITGYTLQMNATSGSPTALTNSAASPAATIPTLSQAYSSANFPVNSWGYTGGLDKSSESGGYDCSTNYCPILAYQSNDSNYAPNHVIKVTDAPATTSNTNITFGAKVDISKPSGTYSTSVTFTAVTNAVPITTMQSFDASSCATMSTGDTITLRDTRDNEEYLIGKLADNNCWMLDNMRLDLANSTVLNSLTTDNTNVDSASLTSRKSGNRAAGDRYASSGFTTWAQGDTTNVYPQARANADYKNTTTTSYGAGSGKIGVYYNYCAASAGNYCYDKNAGVDDPSTLQDAQYDICPKNWRVPTSDDSGEYQALYTAYSSNATNFRNALSTPFSGHFRSGSASYQGSYGYFWSSTSIGGSYMNYLDVDASYVTPSSHYERCYGFSVRCLLGS